MEGVYSRSRHMGEQGKFGECEGVGRRVREGVWGRGRRTQVTGARRREGI